MCLYDASHSAPLRSTVRLVCNSFQRIKTADWLIDMGPEGGAGGGMVVGVGTPEELAANPASHTGRYLLPYLCTKFE